MEIEEHPRNEIGQFEARPDSLHPKTIGLRLSKKDYPIFLELAKVKGIRPTELARIAVAEYVHQHSVDD